MGYDLYLSYSGRKCYLTCGRQYLFRYVEKVPALPQDRRGAIFGIVIGTVFEWFYGKALWSRADPTAACLEASETAIAKTLRDEKLAPDFDRAFLTELRKDLRTYIPPAVDLIRREKLISDSTRVEYDLTVEHTLPGQDVRMKLGGRADFFHVFRNAGENVVWILDGKGTRHKETYTDPEQLIWYGTQTILKHGVAPSRLGFIYYKFPEDALKWLEYGHSDVAASLKTTFRTARNILDKDFDPRPSAECRRCDYSDRCPEGKQWMDERNVEARAEIVDSVFDLELIS